MKKILNFFLSIFTAVTIFSCSNKNSEIKDLTFTKNLEFEGININITLEELSKSGFEYGDLLNFEFSNGAIIENVPYSTDYIVKREDIIFCYYRTYTYPHLCRNCGSDIFDDFNLSLDDTVTIKIAKKGGFKTNHDALARVCSNNRVDFKSDEVFANFRRIDLPKIKSDKFYRGCSPVNNANNRAKTASSLIEKYDIDYIIDLSTDENDFTSYATSDDVSEVWKTLYNQNKICNAKVSADYASIKYYPQMKKACEFIINNEGKFYFHCNEGKDRTGFFAILLEALASESLKNIEKDYMASYENYFNITKENDINAYDAIFSLKFEAIITFLANVNDFSLVDEHSLNSGAKAYLGTCGLSNEQIDLLISKISIDKSTKIE